MRGTMLYGPRDVRFEESPDPTIVESTDVVVRLSVACVVRVRGAVRSDRRYGPLTTHPETL